MATPCPQGHCICCQVLMDGNMYVDAELTPCSRVVTSMTLGTPGARKFESLKVRLSRNGAELESILMYILFLPRLRNTTLQHRTCQTAYHCTRNQVHSHMIINAVIELDTSPIRLPEQLKAADIVDLLLGTTPVSLSTARWVHGHQQGPLKQACQSQAMV